MMTTRRTYLSIAVCAVTSGMLASGVALADAAAPYPSYEPSSAVKNGYSAEDLRDAEVRGANGDKIGDVEDLIIGPNGQLRRLIIAVNQGWFGTGGRRLAVNWDDVTPGPKSGQDLEYVTVPVAKRNIEEFGLFKDKPAAVDGKAREWRASELLGDYVDLKDLDDYGSVTDLMFDKEGKLLAIAAAPDISSNSIRSFYAPYAGADAGWDPGDDYYVIPYTKKELSDLLPEDQSRTASANG